MIRVPAPMDSPAGETPQGSGIVQREGGGKENRHGLKTKVTGPPKGEKPPLKLARHGRLA
jgi:hypothetical protein